MITSNPNGDYYRLLADGSYAIQVKKAGYETQVKYIKVHNKDQQVNAQRIDFTLQTISSERADLQQMLRQFMNKY
jgi:ribosomal protein S4E